MIVSDAGPLIVFARVQRLELLQAVAGHIVVPDAVYDEVVVRGVGKPGSREIAESAWITRQAVDGSIVLTSPLTGLHAGELEALHLARQLALPLLIDERLGRRVAEELGIEIVGSLVVLAEAKRIRILDSVGPILAEMRQSGYRLGQQVVEQFLASLGETGQA